MPLDILCTLFTAGSFWSAAAKELFPTLELVPHLKRGCSRLYQTRLQGLQGISDKAFQLAAASGKSTSMFCMQYLNASHPSPFRLLSQITAKQLRTFPEIHDSYRGDPAFFMITQFAPTFGLFNPFLLTRKDTEIASPLLAASHFWDELSLPCWRNLATQLLLLLTFFS